MLSEEKMIFNIFFTSHDCVLSACLQGPAALHAAFHFLGLGVELRAQHILSSHSATELHPAPKQYAAYGHMKALNTCNQE